MNSTDSDDRTATSRWEASETNTVQSRYLALEVAEEQVIIYDAENHRQWLQADHAVTRDEIR